MFKLNKLIAFTLSEVLMVIGIIGVVAAITLPNTSTSTGNKINVAKAKKVYSELAAAWDKAMLRDPITNSTNLTMQGIVNKIGNNLKVKGTGAIYAPADTDNCKNTAILLSDGSTFCVLNKIGSFFPLRMDIDGPNKGSNTTGSDLFNMRIYFDSNSINPPSLEPFAKDSGTASTIMTSGTTMTDYANTALLWILTYDNMDYKDCQVKWITKTTCK